MHLHRRFGAGSVPAAAIIAACSTGWPQDNSHPTEEHQPMSAAAKKIQESLELEHLGTVQIPSGATDTLLRPVKIELPGGRKGWALRLEGGHPLATPAISDGKLYIGGGFGGFDFYSIDAATGDVVWRVRTTDDGPTGAVAYGDFVVFNTESCAVEVRLKKNGQLVWGRWLGDPLMSQPAVAADRVLICYPNHGSGPHLQGDAEHPPGEGPVTPGTVVRVGVPVKGEGSHALGCFKLTTGQVLWAQAVPADCISAPVVEQGIVYTAHLDGTVTQIELATGKLIRQEQRQATSAPWIAQNASGWEAIVSQRESREETVGGKSVLVHSEGLRRIDPATGEMSEDKQFFQPAEYLAKSTVNQSRYFTEGMKEAADSAVGFSTAPAQANLSGAAGNVGISRVVDAWPFQGSRPTVAGGRLFNTLGNKVTAGAQDGKSIEWEFAYQPETKERLLSPPAVAGDELVFAALDGTVFSLEARSGQIRRSWRFDKRVVSQPAVVDGRIFLGTLDGWLIAIETGDRDLDGWSMWGGGPAHNGR